MNKIIALLSSFGGLVMMATTAFAQTGPAADKPAPAEPVQRDHQKSSSVTIRQSGSGNRAVVHQSANGTTMEVVQGVSGSNTVEVHHDGNTTVVIDQPADQDTSAGRPEQAIPHSTKRKH